MGMWRVRRLLAEPPGERQAVDARHHEVGDHQVGALAEDQLEPLQAVGSGEHLELPPQRHVHELDDVGMVLDHHRRVGAGLLVGVPLDDAALGGLLDVEQPELGAGRDLHRPVEAGLAGAPAPGSAGRRQHLGAEVATPLGKRDGEAGARMAVAVRADAAAVDHHQLARQGQADPRAAVGPAVGHVHLVEALEELIGPFGRESRAVVGDHHLDVVELVAQRHRDVPVRGGELDGVGEQVDEDPLQPLRVAPDGARLLVPREGEGDLLSVCQHLGLLDQAAQLLDQVLLLHVEPEPALLEPGEVEQVVDELEQLERAPVHGRERAALGLAEGAHLPFHHQLEGSDDHGERRAQLVGHVGEEARLELVELLELGVGALQVVGGDLEPEALLVLLAQRRVLQRLRHAGDDGRGGEEGHVGGGDLEVPPAPRARFTAGNETTIPRSITNTRVGGQTKSSPAASTTRKRPA